MIYAVITANGCFNTSNEVQVIVNPVPIVTVSNDTTVCAGTPVILHASGGTGYQWSNGGPATPDFIVTRGLTKCHLMIWILPFLNFLMA